MVRSRIVRFGFCALALALILALPALAQGAAHRPLSPRGQASTQVGGHWVTHDNGRKSYEGGKWIDIDYGRPILRGRTDIFGTGADYGKKVDAGAPVWRAGANQTTRLHTEAALVIGGKRIEPGDYDVFVELAEGPKWTFILSTQPYQKEYDRENKQAIWGSYGYDPKFDIVRAPMTLQKASHRIDQLTFSFADITDSGGTLAIAWENTIAMVGFELAK